MIFTLIGTNFLLYAFIKKIKLSTYLMIVDGEKTISGFCLWTRE